MSKDEHAASNEYKDRNSKNTRNLKIWTIAWIISMAITTFASKFLWDFNTTITLLSVIIHVAIGFGMLLANRRYLRGLDEMQQRIMLDAMALCLGVGLVIGLSYQLLENIRLISFQPEIPHLILIMCLTYAGAIKAGNRKYQ